MADVTEQSPEQQDNLIEAARRDLSLGDKPALQQRMASLHPAEIADLIESLPAPEREQLWPFVPEAMAGEVLAHLGEIARTGLVEALRPQDIIAAAGLMETTDLAEVIDELPEDLGEAILESLAPQHRERIEETLAYPEDSAGRLMDSQVVAVRADVTLEGLLRYLRRRESLPDHTDHLMVIDRQRRYLGQLALATLLTSDPSRTVGIVMQEGPVVRADAPQSEVVRLFERRDLISVAVVREDGRLLGRITVDDVLDVIEERASEHILHMAGLREEEDLFAPVMPSARRRAVWLGINLATALLASWVIGLFEKTLEQVVALAVLMPVVASMGGIAGSQTLTLTIRGLALDQITSANIRWLTFKELAVGVLNGLLWALVVGFAATVWFKDPLIGQIIAAALVINLVVAVIAGVLVPLVLHRWGVDPAVSGAVILTTITDVVGFTSFLGLATVFLL
ncbi:MAG: magnesium transporter [Gammaproteobacteria bacterium]|jgi:magnesium transporter